MPTALAIPSHFYVLDLCLVLGFPDGRGAGNAGNTLDPRSRRPDEPYIRSRSPFLLVGHRKVHAHTTILCYAVHVLYSTLHNSAPAPSTLSPINRAKHSKWPQR